MMMTIFNTVLKELFDLLSVHVSLTKKDEMAITETSVTERYVGKKLPHETNFIWYSLQTKQQVVWV